MRRTHVPMAATSENATQCACESLCEKLVGSARILGGGELATRCNEAIPACSGSVLRRGPHSIAILAENKVYRIKDILAQRGPDWRSDSISILCEPRYRGTLLRKTLMDTGQMNGSPLKGLDDEALEAAVRSRFEGRPGHALRVGRTGPSTITLGTMKANFHAYVQHLQKLHASKRCDVAAADELAIVMRLGDSAPETAKGWMQKADQYLKTSRARLRKAVVCAVLHYDPDGNHLDTGIAPFLHTDRKDQRSFQLIDELIAHLRSRGLETRVRSNPDVDGDMCFYVFSPHVVGVTRVKELYRDSRTRDTGRIVDFDPGLGRPGLFSLVDQIRLVMNYSRPSFLLRLHQW
jgi:hypothetical protein